MGKIPPHRELFFPTLFSVGDVYFGNIHLLPKKTNQRIMFLSSQGLQFLCLMKKHLWWVIKYFGDCLVTRIAKNWWYIFMLIFRWFNLPLSLSIVCKHMDYSVGIINLVIANLESVAWCGGQSTGLWSLDIARVESWLIHLLCGLGQVTWPLCFFSLSIKWNHFCFTGLLEECDTVLVVHLAQCTSWVVGSTQRFLPCPCIGGS